MRILSRSLSALENQRHPVRITRPAPQPFLFFHKRFQDERIRLAVDRKRHPPATLILPLLEDANSIQMALQQVMRLVLHHDVDYKTAGLLLYALQTASSNLRQTKFEALRHDVILDPRDAADTSLGKESGTTKILKRTRTTTPNPSAWKKKPNAPPRPCRKIPAAQSRCRAPPKVLREIPPLQARQRATARCSTLQKDLPAKPPSNAAPAAQAPQLPKKPALPTPEEFDRDIHDLTRKHFFPDMPDDIYNKAIAKKENG